MSVIASAPATTASRHNSKITERIFDLAALPGVRQILEIAKKDGRFAKRPDFMGRTLHRNPPIGGSVGFDESELR
jgi:hypothetical protein